MTSSPEITAAIIEDEYPAARLLHHMLQELRPQWNITIIPGSIQESVAWFASHKHPDILFLDIQLTDGISFMFIEQANPESMIVFTTAYDEYAVHAFTVNSIDYLLKPVHKERLLDTINKFERLNTHHIKEMNNQLDIYALIQSIERKQEKNYRSRFLINGKHHCYTINVNDIAYFRSEEKITFAITKDGKEHIVDFPLSRLEEQLDERLFFRANRQFLVSADCIKSIEPYFNNKAIIHIYPPQGERIQISREKITDLKSWLNS